jgi:hypothetical protein
MRTLFYIVSAILIGVMIAGLIYVINSRTQRIERRMSSAETHYVF